MCACAASHCMYVDHLLHGSCVGVGVHHRSSSSHVWRAAVRLPMGLSGGRHAAGSGTSTAKGQPTINPKAHPPHTAACAVPLLLQACPPCCCPPCCRRPGHVPVHHADPAPAPGGQVPALPVAGAVRGRGAARGQDGARRVLPRVAGRQVKLRLASGWGERLTACVDLRWCTSTYARTHVLLLRTRAGIMVTQGMQGGIYCVARGKLAGKRAELGEPARAQAGGVHRVWVALQVVSPFIRTHTSRCQVTCVR